MSKKRKTHHLIKREWTPMLPAEAIPNPHTLHVPKEMWKNDRYTVIVERRNDATVSVHHLSIRRNDRKAARDWRDFQRIKNEIAGREVEAVELYPRQSRIVDCSNQYHLWVAPPGVEITVGYPEGKIASVEEAEAVGAVQREGIIE